MLPALAAFSALWMAASAEAVAPARHPRPSHLQEHCLSAFADDHAAFKRCLQSGKKAANGKASPPRAKPL